jgi:glycerol uptake facilitator-like aquaporin
MFGRQKVATLAAELLGTGALTLIVLTIQRSTIGVPFFVAAGAGLIVALMTFALLGSSQAHFNPAVTLSVWTARKIETVTAILYIIAQLLGALGAYYIYTYFVSNTLPDVGGKFTWKIFTAEALGAGVLAFGVAAAVYQKLGRAVTASFVGLSLMLGILVASSASLGLINPAVALGVKAWVWGTYVAGPIVGAIIGFNLYAQLFAPSVGKSAASAATIAKPASAAKAKKPAAKKKSAKAKK